ncbi:MAG: flavodoxin family protein [Methanoregula sp.]|jgi:NAD(P)H-dependent FMN reductase|uniref:flavodoxin family protein n=1 Tax=Methanoregula sp. TaxID=2052170 RepID=UPI0025F2F7C2|nr:flavodoxin family protein [Methanoregula sp.]MCK9631508.1 flavodoxin family protein [Methanoregula sp.]
MAGRVIGILGSPLPEGNTAQLLDRALEGAKDAGCTVEKIVVTNLCFDACQEMFFCRDHETCVMDDDMQQLYPKVRDADSIILATPIMCMGIPGKLKSFIDRCQVFFMAKYLRKKSLVPAEKRVVRKALFICISGMKVPEVFVGAKLTVKAFFDIIDCTYWDELLVSDMDTIGDITQQPGLMDAAYDKGFALGKTLNP